MGFLLAYSLSCLIAVNYCPLKLDGQGGLCMNDIIKNKLTLLPDQPGCYLMKDRQGTIIYVGKAKVSKKSSTVIFYRLP